MRFLFIALFIAPVAWAANEAPKEKPAIAQPIAELKLTNGTVFRNVTIVRYERENVVLKISGNNAPFLYRYISEPLRTQMLATRDIELAKPKPTAGTPVPVADKPPQIYEGQAFIVTRGAGNYKLGDMTVYAFPMSVWSEAESTIGGTMRLGKPFCRTNTDAEGKFKLSPPNDEDFFLFAQGSRLAGGSQEFYQWTIKSTEFKDRSNAILTNSNLRGQRKIAVIDEEK